MESEVKWTEGPWEAREVRTQVGRAFRIGAGEMLEAGKGCCIVYDDYCGNPDNERAANARLIAAAPDLYEAALQALWHLGSDDDRVAMSPADKWQTSREQAADKLRAALSRARGAQ